MLRIIDLILICLASVILLQTTYGIVESIFATANSWIPDAFGDEVQWHPGETFNWGLSSVLTGLFLCRFAVRPVFTGFLIALIIVIWALYPSVQQMGIKTTINQLFFSFETAKQALQLLGLLPVITWLLQWLIRPSRVHEEIEDSNN